MYYFLWCGTYDLVRNKILRNLLVSPVTSILWHQQTWAACFYPKAFKPRGLSGELLRFPVLGKCRGSSSCDIHRVSPSPPLSSFSATPCTHTKFHLRSAPKIHRLLQIKSCTSLCQRSGDCLSSAWQGREMGIVGKGREGGALAPFKDFSTVPRTIYMEEEHLENILQNVTGKIQQN